MHLRPSWKLPLIDPIDFADAFIDRAQFRHVGECIHRCIAFQRYKLHSHMLSTYAYLLNDKGNSTSPKREDIGSVMNVSVYMYYTT